MRARPRARSISWWSSASSSTPSGTSAASISASVRPSQLSVAQSRVAGSMETAGNGETLDAGALLEVRVVPGMGASGSRLPGDGADRRAACTEARPAISRLGASAISWLGQMAIAPLGWAPATHGGGSRDGLAPLRGPTCEERRRSGQGTSPRPTAGARGGARPSPLPDVMKDPPASAPNRIDFGRCERSTSTPSPAHSRASRARAAVRRRSSRAPR